MYGKIYLIPNTLGDCSIDSVIPAEVKKLIPKLSYFVVENERTVRRYLKKVDKSIEIDDLQFFMLNKHTDKRSVERFLAPVLEGHNLGIISEAGAPGIADPGSEIVELAHKKNIQVVPLVGPSSIMLALMASGFNGQNFIFHGYLPIKSNQKMNKLKELEKKAFNERQTQIFMETPYRNNKLIQEIIKTCHPGTNLCIAANITTPGENIRTKTIAEWKKEIPDLHKIPCIFLLESKGY
jgi:16S rRNA (cytidine1402-2'-O)-methyltransferase